MIQEPQLLEQTGPRKTLPKHQVGATQHKPLLQPLRQLVGIPGQPLRSCWAL